jgi:DNA-binding XRE family transcriptional regulator
MGKLSAGFDLEIELRRHRKRAGVTQRDLARKAGLSERTVRALEQTSGTLDSWNAALDTLKLTLVGRNLPAGTTLGKRLAMLRRRRRISQEELARSVSVTRPTLGALEREDKGRLSTLQQVLTVLGAGAYLAARDSEAAFYTHAGNSSVDHGWETPPEILEALYRVFRRFDLDPCAPRKSRTVVRARTHFTAEDDGLSLPWHGTVFVNPPYGRMLAAWIAKAHEEVLAGRARTVVALLPARPDTRYWHEVRRVTAREDHRNMRYGLDVRPMGHRTYLKAKARGDNSMFGKAGRTETVEVRAGRSPDGMVKPTPVEPQCPNCKQYRSDMTVDIRRPSEPGDCSCPHGNTSRAGRAEVQRPQGHERGTYNHPIVPRARNTGLPTGREP